jgi:hypothetical protein
VLDIGVGTNEIDSNELPLDHVVDSIASTSTYPDNCGKTRKLEVEKVKLRRNEDLPLMIGENCTKCGSNFDDDSGGGV